MPKRSLEEKIEYYKHKMDKLLYKHSHKRRRRESISSFDDDDQGGENTWVSEPLSEGQPEGDRIRSEVVIPMSDKTLNCNEAQLEVLPESTAVQEKEINLPSVTNVATAEAPDPTAPDAPAPVQVEPPLDPDILSALGEPTDQGPMWGQDIHSNLKQLWLPLLKKGMSKEIKDQILKQYLIPSNCTLLQAPKLNIKICAAIPEMVRLRDKKVETSQQQLGIGITAISRAMTSLITNDNKIEAIKTLSDGCRILCDLHYNETQARIKMITPGLAKPFLNVIQDSERDETLFGISLPDRIKASKTIEKQGLQIKKVPMLPVKTNVTAQPQSSTQTRQQFQGNWAGPPRYPTNRGGRGGQRKYPVTARRSAPASAAATSQAKSSTSRSRATRQ